VRSGGVRPSTTTIAGASTSAGSGDTPAGGVTTTTVPVEIRRETGTLQGQGAGEPVLLRFIDDTSTDSAITVGATVDTAGGTNGLAPQGLPIGTITKISPQSGSQSRLVEVTPTASLKQLNFVSVVLYTPGQTANG
jgi:cell shape-determining protein MreC